MCEAVCPSFRATSTNRGGGPAPGRAWVFAARGGGAAVGPIAAGACVCSCVPPAALAGADACLRSVCAHTTAVTRQTKRKAQAASLAGFRGMNQAILAQTHWWCGRPRPPETRRCAETAALGCPGGLSPPLPYGFANSNRYDLGSSPLTCRVLYCSKYFK